MIHIDLDWKDHPTRRRGLYTSVADGRGNFTLQVLDESYEFPPGYEYTLDGRTRSPYYDQQCLELTPQRVAIELDKDYAGAAYQAFDAQLIGQLLSTTAREPTLCGSMTYDPETLEATFTTQRGGDFRLWLTLGEDGKPPRNRRFVLGADTSGGRGTKWTSNSSLAIYDRDSGEQVGAYDTRHMKPDDWACFLIAVCKWFRGEDEVGCLLIWETNGAGGAVTTTVVERHYGHVYRRKEEDKHGARTKNLIGWHSKGENKFQLLFGVKAGGLASAMRLGRIKVRDRKMLLECPAYQNNGGVVFHSKAKTTDDPGEKGVNHADRVIAHGCANLGISYKAPEPDAPLREDKRTDMDKLIEWAMAAQEANVEARDEYVFG